LHEAFLCGADKRPAVSADSPRLTGSRLHFLKKLAFAAPASGLPSLLTALLSQVPCADAKAKFNDSSNAARRTRFMYHLPSLE